MKNILILILILQFAGLTACSNQVSFRSMESMAELDNKPLDEVEQCKLPVVDYMINAKVTDFVMYDNWGVDFGFGDGFSKAFGLKLKVERGEMSMNMELKRPLNPDVSIIRPGKGQFRKTGFGIEIDFIKAGIDLNYFKQTPLAQLTKATLEDNIKNIVIEMEKTKKWSAFVHFHPMENEIVIPAGTFAGLVVGDRFEIFNYKRIWAGEPCQSEMFYTDYHSVAIAEVALTTDSSATLKVVKGNGKDIQVGAQVLVDKLVTIEGQPTRSLKPSVGLTGISSQKLLVDGKNEIDITNYMKEQIKYLLPEHGFYLRN